MHSHLLARPRAAHSLGTGRVLRKAKLGESIHERAPVEPGQAGYRELGDGRLLDREWLERDAQL